MNTTTITITVNIATGNKYEGNAEFRINIPENHLPYINPTSFKNELAQMITEARKQYEENNK